MIIEAEQVEKTIERQERDHKQAEPSRNHMLSDWYESESFKVWLKLAREKKPEGAK